MLWFNGIFRCSFKQGKPGMARRKPYNLQSNTHVDRHQLYEQSVQQPEITIGLIEDLAEAISLPEPVVLGEDFCGTAQLAVTWVHSGRDRRAVAVDLDDQVIDWARTHHLGPLAQAAERLSLITGDVMTVADPVDVLLSLNFSHFIYHQVDAMDAYFRHAFERIAGGGMMLIDCFGGRTDTRQIDERAFSGFDYLWDQGPVCPRTNRIDCAIHFRLSNGRMLRHAFTYNWRLWSPIELEESLSRAGFSDVGVYFETEEGFSDDLSLVNPEAWVCYLVAVKS